MIVQNILLGYIILQAYSLNFVLMINVLSK